MTKALADTQDWSHTFPPTLDDGLVGLLIDTVEALTSAVDCLYSHLDVELESAADYEELGANLMSALAVFQRTEDWNAAVNPDPAAGVAVIARLKTEVASYLRVAAEAHHSQRLHAAATKLERGPVDESAMTDVQQRLGRLITETVEGVTRTRFGVAPSARG